MRPYEIRFDWLWFAQSYLSIALLACDEMMENKYKEEILPGTKIESNKYNIYTLFLPAIYNVKHGIEVFIKTLKKILGVEISIKNRDKPHNIIRLFEGLKGLVKKGHIKKVLADAKKANPSDADLPAAKEDLKNIEKYIGNLEKLVSKYQRCDFLRVKIKSDFEIKDENNTTFRYPENSLNIQIDYEKVLLRLTKRDIIEIRKDVKALRKNFNSLGYILEIYSQYK